VGIIFVPTVKFLNGKIRGDGKAKKKSTKKTAKSTKSTKSKSKKEGGKK
jgi:hypothetical protein